MELVELDGGPREVGGRRHLAVGIVAEHRDHPSPDLLDQAGVVGRSSVGRMGAAQHAGVEALGGLHGNHVVAVDRSADRLAGVAAMVLGLLSPAAAPPPDMLVSAEARMIAVRSDGFYLQSRSGASRFVLDAWQRYLAAGPPLPLRTNGAGVPCDADVCRVEAAGTLALLLRRDVQLAD